MNDGKNIRSTTDMLDAKDLVEIQMVLSLYCHLVDGRHWTNLVQVFTDDVVFDATAHGVKVMVGLAALQATWEKRPPPSLHYTVNTYIRPVSPDSAHVQSKTVGLLPEMAVRAGLYRDLVVRTPDGWRIQERTAYPAAHAPDLPAP